MLSIIPIKNNNTQKNNPNFMGIRTNESASKDLLKILEQPNWQEIKKKFNIEIEDYYPLPLRLYIKRMKDTSEPTNIFGKIKKALKNIPGKIFLMQIEDSKTKCDLEQFQTLNVKSIEEFLQETEKKDKSLFI